MGGRDAVMKAAGEAIDAGEYTWAAEILTNVIRVDNSDMKARRLKAEAYRQFAYTLVNVNWRNWALTAAAELDRMVVGDIEITGEMASAIAEGAPAGGVAMLAAIDSGEIRIEGGSIEDVQKFFSYFDSPTDPGSINLIVR